jgi:pilus assembly protein CpaF
MTRLQDGTRKITTIAEVRGVERDRVEVDDVFTFDRHGQSESGRSMGKFRGTGHRPKVLDRLKSYGVNLSPSIFAEEMEVKDR